MGDFMAIDYAMIGKRLKESRRTAKLTQEKVAIALAVLKDLSSLKQNKE